MGYSQESRDREGVSRNTVVGNVEIGKSSGDEINRDISKFNETTRDDYSRTDINVESQTIEYAVNPDKLKEDIGKAKQEIADVTRAFKESVNDRGDDNRNFFGQLSEVRLNETIDNIAGERLDRASTQEDIKDTLEAAYKDLGYDVEIRFSTSSETPELNGKGGTAYVGDDGKHTVIINSGYLNGKTKGEILGVISEEASHVINGAEGRQISTGTDEKGLESTGRATNEYFKDKYKDDDTTISLTSEGAIDTSKLGTNVGDDKLARSVAETFNKRLVKEELDVIEKKFSVLELNTFKNLSNEAEEGARNFFPNGSLYQDEADAFRHAYWNALVAQKFGDKGFELTYAHEGLKIGQEPETKYKNGDLEDAKMDIHNNRIGYNIGINNPKASKRELQILILRELNKGNLSVMYPISYNEKSSKEKQLELEKKESRYRKK